jgi:large subunit ribosomal protein L31
MKQGIHPKYEEITIVMTDGSSFKTRSTLGQKELRLDVDPKTHPAWVGGVNLRKTGQMEKFNNKFAFLGAATGGKAEKKEDKKDAK